MQQIRTLLLSKGRSFRMALAVPCCVVLLLLASLFVLFYTNRISQERYRADNLLSAQKTCESIDIIFREAQNFGLILEKDSPNAAPFFASAGRAAVKSQLSDPESGFPFPFVKNSLAYNLTCCTRNLILANAHFDIAAIYAPQSGYYLVSSGPQATPQCIALDSFERLKEHLCLTAPLTKEALLTDKSLAVAEQGLNATPSLLVVNTLDNGLMTLCGVSSLGLAQTVFQDVYQHGYRLQDAYMILPSGERIHASDSAVPPLSDAELSRILNGASDIVLADGQVIMRCAHEDPGFTLLIFLCADQALRLFDSNLLPPFLLIVGIWLVAISVVCLYTMVKYTRPLDKLASEVSAFAPVQGETDAFTQISSVVKHLNRQMLTDQNVIAQQRQQLGNSFLLELLLYSGRTATQEELDKYQISTLVTQYVVLTVTSGCGSWSDLTLSEQEQAYRTSLALLKVENIFRTHLTGWRSASMRHQSELIVVLAATQDSLARLNACLSKAAGAVQAQILESAVCSLSTLHEGVKSLHAAYLETLMDGNRIGAVRSVAVPTVSMLELNQLDNRMASLIYVESYEKAFVCFQSMVHLIFACETNPVLRKIHLQSLVMRTYCMLIESNADNTKKLIPLPSFTECLDLNNQTEFLTAFERVFSALSAHEGSNTPTGMSPLIQQAYSYMQTHFKDANLSLSLLADTFQTTSSTLSREFQKNMGVGFLDLLHKLRLDAAIDEIIYTNHSLRDVAAHVGYNNELTLSRAFKKYEGVTPGSLRRQPPSS